MGSNHPSTQYCKPGLGTGRGAWEGRTIWNSEAGRPPRDRVLGWTLDKEHAWKPPYQLTGQKLANLPAPSPPKSENQEMKLKWLCSALGDSAAPQRGTFVSFSLLFGQAFPQRLCAVFPGEPLQWMLQGSLACKTNLGSHHTNPPLQPWQAQKSTQKPAEPQNSVIQKSSETSRQGRFSWSLLQNLFKTILRVLPIGVSEKLYPVETIQFPLPRHDEIPFPKGVSLPILSTAQNSQIPTSFP